MPRIAILAALLPLVLGACAPDAAHPLDGHTYVSVSVAGHTLVKGTHVELGFANGDVGVEAGCNHMSGSYKLSGGTLRVGTLSSTEMGCEPQAKMDQDQWIAAFLSSDPDAVLTGRVLTLSQDGTTIVLSEKIVTDQPLKQTRWLLIATVTGSGPDATTQTVAHNGGRPTLRIIGRTARVTTPCATWSSGVKVAGATISFTTPPATESSCSGAKAHLEAQMRRVLAGAATYQISGKRLTVTSEDGQEGLDFRAS